MRRSIFVILKGHCCENIFCIFEASFRVLALQTTGNKIMEKSFPKKSANFFVFKSSRIFCHNFVCCWLHKDLPVATVMAIRQGLLEYTVN
jgi:hypothetical protein